MNQPHHVVAREPSALAEPVAPLGKWRQLLLLLATGVLTTLVTTGIGLSGTFPPAPEVHDEFGILLAADTYASGRLTNPPHPMARFFDTIYVIQQPTYMGKYPPIQGLMLALGKVLTGEFIVGAYVSCGIMAAAILWMLQGFVNLRWALYGTLIAVLQIGIFSYWSHSYWGSTMAVAAGATVLGATVRILRQPKSLDSIVLAVGLIILANARPYDGLAAAIVPMLALLWKGWTVSGDARLILVRRVAIPCTIILALGAVWMGYNNHRVTGNALKMAYQAHSEQYMIVPAFLWQRIADDKKSYSHESLRVHHEEWEVPFYQTQRSLRGFLLTRARFLDHIWSFYANWVLTIPIVVGLCLAIKRPYSIAVASMICVFAATMLTTWSADRFVSPVGSVFFLLVTLGMRQLAKVCMNSRIQSSIIASVPVLILVMMLGFQKQVITPDRASVHPMKQRRVEVLQRLTEEAGQDLVFVRSTPRPDSYFEWVYNGANIDQQGVVFARYRSVEDNLNLIAYYANRRVWLLDVGANNDPVQLKAYGSEIILPRRSD